MSNQETEVKAIRGNSFASRMLTKQLTERKTGEQAKVKPSDAAKFAVPETEAPKEKVTV